MHSKGLFHGGEKKADHPALPLKPENKHTLPETNIAPENRPSQKETSIPTIHFQVPW